MGVLLLAGVTVTLHVAVVIVAPVSKLPPPVEDAALCSAQSHSTRCEQRVQ